MNRIDRLSAILIQLQSKKIVKAQDIADRFEISLRTVYRDVRALEEAGVPIGAEAGKGYFIIDGYYLPPVTFTKEEAGAILMAAKLMALQTDKSVHEQFDSALYKIKAVLRTAEQEYLESLETNIEVRHLPNRKSEFPDNFLTDIQTALASDTVVQFDYYSNHSDQFTSRCVEPLSLCFYSNRWHLIGYCQLREALRDFRTDRIMKLKTLDKPFDRSRHKNYDSYLENIMMASDLTEVKIEFSRDISRYVGEQKYYHGFIEQKKTGDTVLMTFMTGSLRWFAHWILMYGKGATIISPNELHNLVQKLAREAFEHHANGVKV